MVSVIDHCNLNRLSIPCQTFLRNEEYLTRVHVAAIPASQGDTLYVPPHWHVEHDELFRVLKGRLRVTIGGQTRDYVPSDGEIRIPKGVVHSIRGIHDEETIFEERTDPMVPFLLNVNIEY